MARTKTPGIRQRGSSFEAWVFDRRAEVVGAEGKISYGKKMYRTFESYAAAKQWRLDAASQVHKGTMRAPLPITVREACEAWLEGAGEGLIRTRSGAEFKPAVLRGYESAFRLRVFPQLGALRLADIRRADLQDFADKMIADKLDPSTVRGTLMGLRSVVRRSISRDELYADPFVGLALRTPTGTRERVAEPAEAEELFAAVPEEHRAIWACAFYGGLRRGELQALKWGDVLDDRIHVCRSWDAKAGFIAPKSKRGTRDTMLVAPLRAYLNRHRLLTGRREGLVFGSTDEHPFTPSNVRRRAVTAWSNENKRRAKAGRKDLLTPLGLHECRHSFVTNLYSAGLSLERIGDYAGHSATYMTERYKHLLEGHQVEAAAVFDAYLEKKLNGAATGAGGLQSV